MKTKKRTVQWKIRGCCLYLMLAGHTVFCQSYTLSPVVPDFTDLQAPCVVGTCGNIVNPFQQQGIVPDRHAVITRQGTDPNTGDALKLIPAGEAKVVKLGNDRVGGEAESVTYHFVVDPDRTVLLLKFAVVFQDPSHPTEAQPRFVVRIMNKEGELIETCAEYDVSARAGIEGFRSFNMNGTPVRWRDWTNVGLDMSAYAGKEVQVQFVTYDCDYSGHFGYAYFTATCISNQLQLTACEGESFTVSAPESFESYWWNNGETTPVTRWVRQAADMNITCEVSSVTGCRFTLSAVITGDDVPADPVYYDTVCQGEGYTLHNYNLSPRQEVGTFCYDNNYLDLSNCRSTGKTTLYLTVRQRFYPIDASICEGESYLENGFSYVKPAAGKYYDTLAYPRPLQCDSLSVLNLTVFPRVAMEKSITGDASPCTGSVQTYAMQENWEPGSYSWVLPEGYTLLSEQGWPEIVVQVTDAAREGEVHLMYAAGCASGIRPFKITPRPAYWGVVNDTVCSGTEYRDQGFHIPRQDSAGLFTFVNHGHTVAGCDSVTTLYLFVHPTPELEILASDSVICQGQDINLKAVGKEAKFVVPHIPEIAVGDIYCKSGKIVKPHHYSADGGDPAEGVVFWVSNNGRHGWMAALDNVRNEDTGDSWRWFDSDRFIDMDIPKLPNYQRSLDAAKDTSGYLNTKFIRAVGNSERACPAAWCMDFDHGWYLPAAGQMSQLFAVIFDINPSLEIAGGTPLSTRLGAYERYWTSSETHSSEAWNITLWSGFISTNKKGYYYWVRAVKSF